ncbi:DNA polymerase III subunit beta [Basilea psittacipulmonis]|uniref:Beta sliding clamp n=1 Tax=Basilea psittacipulmonis DSM 24701 TaxID=1072685 RepID=A0A077DAM5_9BURK|nr:DNA polymerase III subunit beta [Basilea psittacipulmonis]AIL31945.1 DNA polymerase III subunit beta [Basilea psittacipulmonis DSM 24701]
MQLLKTSKESILKPLQTVAGIIENRSAKPILVNVLIEKKGGQLSFLATDESVQIKTHAQIGLGDSEMATTVAARKLLDILRALPDGADVSLEEEGGMIVVKSGRSRYTLQTLPSMDYPVVKQPENWTLSFAMPQRILCKLLNQVHYAMAEKDIRYYLNGVLLEFKGNVLTAVATDGHRMAKSVAVVEGISGADHSIIIPRKAIHELQRLLDESDELVTVGLTDSQISLSFGDVEIVSKLVEGKFPDYSRVIDTTYEISIHINREELLGALRRSTVLLAADKKDQKGVKLHFENNMLRLQAHNSEQEESMEEVAIHYEGVPIDTAFKSSYLQDVLAMAKSEEVVWTCQSSGSSSVFITIPQDDTFRYVVMPMRV